MQLIIFKAMLLLILFKNICIILLKSIKKILKIIRESSISKNYFFYN